MANSNATVVRVPRLRGRERFWRELELYLEFWAIAREPLAKIPRRGGSA